MPTRGKKDPNGRALRGRRAHTTFISDPIAQLWSNYNIRSGVDGAITPEQPAVQNCLYDRFETIYKKTSIKPSLLIVPARFKSGKLYSQLPTSGAGDFTVTRATSATRVNGNGLIEIAKTNLAFNSQTWDASNNWQLSESSGRVTVVTSTSGTLAPDGTSTANAISPTSGNIQHYLYSNATGTISYVSGTVYTLSAFFKKGAGDSGRYVQMASRGGVSGFVGNPYANFDLELGTTLIVSGSVADSNRVSRIQNYGNGWYRCSLTATCSTSSNSTVGVLAALLTADTNARLGAAFAGNTSDYIFGWGAQLEEGSSASEYIPTTTVARTTFAGVTVDGTAAANIPRLDYLQPDGTIGCPALLVEPSAQNLALQSENFDTTWSPTGITITTGSTADFTAPDGSTNAYLLTSTSDITASSLSQNITVASGTSSLSVFAKVGNYGLFRIGNVLSSARAAWFNLDAGVVTGTVNGGTASMQNYGNGWYRCTFTPTTTVSGSNAFIIGISNAPNGTFGVSGSSIYFWGAQLETGSVATSYIPTTTAAVTRSADVITDTTASGVIGQTEGTIYAEVDVRNFSNNSRIIAICDGTSNNRIIFLFTTSSRFRILVSVDGNPQVDLIGSSQVAGIFKLAAAYKENDYAFYINGSQVGTDTSALVPACSQVILGKTESSSNTFHFNDRIRAAALYTTRLTNAELALITQP